MPNINNNRLIRITNIVASGCSQTADGIGGLPPSDISDGGCSYIDDGQGGRRTPKSWIGHVAQHFNITSLVNLAACSHGNVYLSTSLIELLTRQLYSAHNTLVLFNITDPNRLDFACSHDHHAKSRHLPYDKTLIDYAWLDPLSSVHKSIAVQVGIEQAEHLSNVALTGLLSFLDARQFSYFFVMMNDYSNHPVIANLVTNRPEKIILTPGLGMLEFAKHHDLLDETNHPTPHGHYMIAQQVIENITAHCSK